MTPQDLRTTESTFGPASKATRSLSGSAPKKTGCCG